MEIREKYSTRKPIVINSEWGVTLTDNKGNRYELKENKDRDGFEILCSTGVLNIKTSCSNVIYVSAEK